MILGVVVVVVCECVCVMCMSAGACRGQKILSESVLESVLHSACMEVREGHAYTTGTTSAYPWEWLS